MSAPPEGTEVDPKGASGAAVAKAVQVLDRVFGHLAPGNSARLKKLHIKLIIIPVSLRLTDLTEYARLTGVETLDSTPEHPRTYDDIRGAGGELRGDEILYAIAEEELSVLPGHPSPYGTDHTAIHESGHVVYNWGLTEGQKATVDQLWAERKADPSSQWLAPSGYTSVNPDEYFANSVAAYFSASYSAKDAVVATYTPQWLQEHDPKMYRLLTQIFPATGAGTEGTSRRLVQAGAIMATAIAAVAVALTTGGDGEKGSNGPVTAGSGFFIPSVIEPSTLVGELPVEPVPSDVTTDPDALGVEGEVLDAYEEGRLLLDLGGFLFHEGLDPSAEDSWPDRVEGSFNWKVSYLQSRQGALAVQQAREAGLGASGFHPLALPPALAGQGISAFEPATPRGAGLVTQIWYWTRGNAFLAIAGSGKFPLGSPRPDQEDLFDTLNRQLREEPSPTGAPFTETQAGRTYSDAIAPVNDAAPAFRARAQDWDPTTTNTQAESDAQPLATALDGVESDVLTIAGRYAPARPELRAVIAAVEVVKADLSDLTRLDATGVVAWVGRYDADVAVLTKASNGARAALGLPTASS